MSRRTPGIREDHGCPRCEEYEAECEAMDDRIKELEAYIETNTEALDWVLEEFSVPSHVASVLRGVLDERTNTK